MFGFRISSRKSEEDIKVLDAIRRSHDSLRVVGRGTVVISPEHIAASDNFKKDLERARKLVRG